jgi:hypothetical protein
MCHIILAATKESPRAASSLIRVTRCSSHCGRRLQMEKYIIHKSKSFSAWHGLLRPHCAYSDKKLLTANTCFVNIFIMQHTSSLFHFLFKIILLYIYASSYLLLFLQKKKHFLCLNSLLINNKNRLQTNL